MVGLARVVSVVAIGVIAVAACGGPGTPKAPESEGAGASDAKAEAYTPPAGPPKAVDCGDFTTCAVVSDRTVRCWGKDKGGELGDGAGADRLKAMPVPGLTGVKTIALASQFVEWFPGVTLDQVKQVLEHVAKSALAPA